MAAHAAPHAKHHMPSTACQAPHAKHHMASTTGRALRASTTRDAKPAARVASSSTRAACLDTSQEAAEPVLSPWLSSREVPACHTVGSRVWTTPPVGRFTFGATLLATAISVGAHSGRPPAHCPRPPALLRRTVPAPVPIQSAPDEASALLVWSQGRHIGSTLAG